MGRHSTLTPEAQEAIRRYVNAGVPVPLACTAAGYSWDTVKGWLKRGRKGEQPYDDFVDAIEQAKAAWAVAMQLNATRAANKGDGNMALRMLEQRYPNHYARPEHRRRGRDGDAPQLPTGERTVLLYPVAMPPGPTPRTYELTDGHPLDVVDVPDTDDD